jgi:methionine biosynthesis protein MetW
MSTLSVINDWIKHGSKVLDLGCGDGEILFNLREAKGIVALGVEIEEKNIEQCLLKNINVIEQNEPNHTSPKKTRNCLVRNNENW